VCVREGQPARPGVARSAPTRRASWWPSSNGGTRPVVTYVLIGINAVVYALQFVLPAGGGIDPVTEHFSMWPLGIALNNEWWRLGTAAFLHGSLLHLAFNMLVLFTLGPTLERVLRPGRYLLLYVMAAIGGGVASYAFSPIATVSVGASGAIFGLMGALIVAGRRLRYDVTQVVILLAINVGIGFISPGIDWRAHLGGLITGAATAAVLVLPGPRHRVLVQVLGIGALLVVMAGLVAWRTAQIQDLVLS
jgi:membrane associated rhomboid family serine protease